MAKNVKFILHISPNHSVIQAYLSLLPSDKLFMTTVSSVVCLYLLPQSSCGTYVAECAKKRRKQSWKILSFPFSELKKYKPVFYLTLKCLTSLPLAWLCKILQNFVVVSYQYTFLRAVFMFSPFLMHIVLKHFFMKCVI